MGKEGGAEETGEGCFAAAGGAGEGEEEGFWWHVCGRGVM